VISQPRVGDRRRQGALAPPVADEVLGRADARVERDAVRRGASAARDHGAKGGAAVASVAAATRSASRASRAPARFPCKSTTTARPNLRTLRPRAERRARLPSSPSSVLLSCGRRATVSPHVRRPNVAAAEAIPLAAGARRTLPWLIRAPRFRLRSLRRTRFHLFHFVAPGTFRIIGRPR